MKKTNRNQIPARIIAGLLLLTSNQVFATSYCSDEAIFAVANFKKQIRGCDASLDVAPLEKLQTALAGGLTGYVAHVRKKMSDVYSLIYTDLPYGTQNPLPSAVRDCVNKLGYAEFDKVKAKVMDALIVCK